MIIRKRQFVTVQPREPFTAVRLAMLYDCECPPEWLEGKNVLEMMHCLKDISETSGFTVIGHHHDLYGKKWIEMAKYGWTVNLSYSQSGASFDAWTREKTIDVNLHWCDESPPESGPSPFEAYEIQLLDLLVGLFKPRNYECDVWDRIYRTLRRSE